MNRYLILILCSLPVLACAQNSDIIKKKQSPYSLNLTLMPQLFINSINVENDGITPEAISAKNTGGYTLGAEIERKGKRGLILNLGLEYGVQYHNITMGYTDLSFFEPSIGKELNDALGPSIKTHIASSGYINLRLIAGYILPFRVLKDCSIEIKAGLSSKCYLSGFSDSEYLGVQIQRNDTVFRTVVSVSNIYIGNPNKNQFGSWQKGLIFDIGISKKLPYHFIKFVNVGLEMTRGFTINGQGNGSGFGYVKSYYLYGPYASNGVKLPSSVDNYRVKDFSFGLRLTAGLWHR